MKRYLRPSPSVPPAVIFRIRQGRVVGTQMKESVRVSAHSGAHYHFFTAQNVTALPVGTPVYVWWAAAGFVCAPVQEIQAEEAHGQSVAEQVRQARQAFAKARGERYRRLHEVDISF